MDKLVFLALQWFTFLWKRKIVASLTSGVTNNGVGVPSGAEGKEHTCQFRRHKRLWFESWVGKIPWRKAWQPTPVFLPRESHGQRRLAGCRPQGFRVGQGWSSLAHSTPGPSTGRLLSTSCAPSRAVSVKLSGQNVQKLTPLLVLCRWLVSMFVYISEIF